MSSAPSRASIVEIAPDNIPKELRRLDQWVNWAGIWSQDKAKFGKPPMTAGGRNASSTDPRTWTTLRESLAALGRDGVYVDNAGQRRPVTLDGIGLAGLGRTPYTGIDLDGCIDPETGKIARPPSRSWKPSTATRRSRHRGEASGSSWRRRSLRSGAPTRAARRT